MKRRHLKAALPGATGFHPGLTQKNLMEENKRPKSSLICCQAAAGRRLPEHCSDAAAPHRAVWEGITSLIPCVPSQKWLKLHKQQRPAREGDNEHWRGFSSPRCCLYSPPPPSLLWQRFWTVRSLWGNLNSLATNKYLNSFKTTGIQQRKGKYPCGASVN